MVLLALHFRRITAEYLLVSVVNCRFQEIGHSTALWIYYSILCTQMCYAKTIQVWTCKSICHMICHISYGGCTARRCNDLLPFESLIERHEWILNVNHFHEAINTFLWWLFTQFVIFTVAGHKMDIFNFAPFFDNVFSITMNTAITIVCLTKWHLLKLNNTQ